jgi:hypothetical protein
MPTSKRPQIDDVQYPRVPSRILKGTSHEEVVNDETDEIMLILNIWSVETPRYPAKLQGVWQSHPRHADLKKVSSQKALKHPEILGRAIRCAPHKEAFIPDVKSWGGLPSWRRRRRSRRKVWRHDERDDGAGGRSSDPTKTTKKPEGGPAT